MLGFQLQQLTDLQRNVIECTVQVATEPLLIQVHDPTCKIADTEADHFGVAHILRNIAVIQHIVGEHLFQLFHEHLGAVGLDKDTVKLRIFFQVSTELQQQWGRITKEVCKFKFFQYFQHLCNDLVFDFLGHTPNIRVMGITAIPVVMPYITSQFMPRKLKDRPEVIPNGNKNLAFIGQFVELEGDVVFTVETAVRTAMIAVYLLLHLDRPITPLFQGQYDIRMVNVALKTLLGKDKIEVSDLPKVNPLKLPQTMHEIVEAINQIPPVPEYYSERKENQ